MRRKHCLLLRFDRYKTHVRSLCRLADCFGIGCISLVALDVRPDKLRGNEAHGMSELGELATPVVRRPACFHANRARLNFREVRQYVCAPQLPTYDDMALRIYSMNLEQVLGQIQANSRAIFMMNAPLPWISRPLHCLWHKRLPPERKSSITSQPKGAPRQPSDDRQEATASLRLGSYRIPQPRPCRHSDSMMTACRSAAGEMHGSVTIK